MMLIDLLSQQPQALGSIVRATPAWVWGLLTALLALGASQLRSREASLARVLSMPVAMAGFAAYGVASAFAPGGLLAWALGVWVATALVAAVLLLALDPCTPHGTRFDAATRRFHLPGSAWPLVLIAGVFLVKYAVGIELSLRPQAASMTHFALPVCMAYGFFNGMFAARALRLWLMARATHSPQPVLA